MNPNETPKDPSFEEFLEGVQEAKNEIEQRRIRAWEKMIPEINKSLDLAHYASDDPQRQSMFNIMYMLWTRGYNAGAQNISDYIARSMGMGPVLDLMLLAENQIIQSPENN